MEITFLGTGAGIPSKERNVTAIMVNVVQEANQLWLFDCGEATQHQLLHTSLKPRKLNKIFITHLHGDHIFGLPGLLSSRSFLGGNDVLTVYGPTGIKQFVETSLQVSETHLSYPIEFVEFDENGIVCEDQSFIVHAQLLDHNIKSFGFRITEKEKLGELKVDKLKEFGIQPGPIYRQIKENDETKLEDGTILYRKDFLGEPKQGKTISIFGDTRYVPQNAAFIQHSDLLIHEATFACEKESLANEYYHSTTTQAATLAKAGNVKKLLLTHISSRYQQEDSVQLLKEAQRIFPNTSIAHDFYTYRVT
ncbi:ribonuclease Z [Pseudogracilibacillus auburnensis]|uniref:ribonuclease Z n=1 Tax=Pseudogracilibacillus auburnensis TaxID=1494959 RepID=UPI001A97CB6A|nr:ribonuclease Z [Pseudogracilibacillus auburnensis]MBO1004331.1 ribonuclease Z [Pseudogracilibacillus auburnensis]